MKTAPKAKNTNARMAVSGVARALGVMNIR
jgi:hypothetical protein